MLRSDSISLVITLKWLFNVKVLIFLNLTFLLKINILNAQDTSLNFVEIWNVDTALNYINNPSFEEFSNCPLNVDQLQSSLYWGKVKDAYDSPDYFHRCANILLQRDDLLVGVPNNFAGHQNPRTGHSYVGIVVFDRSFFKEYIQTHLKRPLTPGEVYIVGMHVNLANNSKYANDRFRFCLSENADLERKYRNYWSKINYELVCEKDIVFKEKGFLKDTLNWVRVEKEFVATGGEEYLTIGVFWRDVNWWQRLWRRKRIVNRNWNESKYKMETAYYYIDDVYLFRRSDYLNVKELNREK